MATNLSDHQPSFSDFPEDVQMYILSFLQPSDISSFASTSKRFVSLSRNAAKNATLWHAMCHRRWGHKTHINKWGDSNISFKLLYKTLSEYQNLIGFWRRTAASAAAGGGGGVIGDAPLVLFEWDVSCITGSRVSPSKDGSYTVIKNPFIWMSLSCEGQICNYIKNGGMGSDMIRVSVNFMGKGHVVLEEENNWGGSRSPIRNGNNGSKKGFEFDNVGCSGGLEMEIGSPPDRMMSEMYQYFANRTSPGSSGERAWRRQRRREKERQCRRKWEPQHLVKIENCSPSHSRPLQGLWKGICDDMSLDFYLVAYDDIGGVSCRRVGDSLKPFSGYAPVFWTSNATFINSPLSREEDYLYNTRAHLRPISELENDTDEYSPSRIMYISSSYELVIPSMAETSANPRHVEGRIWQYVDGTFGFGFLRNNFIVDLKHIARDGCLLDSYELCSG